MRRNILILVSLAVVIAAGAGYVLADRAADERLRMALAEAAEELPEDTRLSYERADANVLEDSARIEGLRLTTETDRAGLVELQLGTVVLSGYSDAAGGTLESADLQDIHFSAMSQEGESADLTADSLTVREIALAALLAAVTDLRDDGKLDNDTLAKLRLKSLAVDGLAAIAPGVNLEIGSLSIEDMGERRTGAVEVRAFNLTLLDAPEVEPSADEAEEDAAEEDAEPESLNIAIAEFRSENLDHLSLIRSLEDETLGIINELAGPFASHTELREVTVVLGELRFGYGSFEGDFQDLEDRQVAEGTMNDFVFEVEGASADDDEMFEDLKELGYDKPRFSASWNVVFEKPEPLLRMQPFTFSLHDGGDLNLSLVLTPPEGVENLRDLAQMEGYEGFSLHEAEVEFVNAGLLQRMLRRQAEENETTRDAVREDLLRQINLQFEDHQDIAEALETFLHDPRRISLHIKLPRAVPMEMFAMAMLIQPRAIAENADVTVKAN
ncbi:MAG: hypothetical protein R3316_01755 [Rhodovibrionaceae bacterium]|nr:hypothetical protein [Rhodovibrionaceae bacterium]